MSLRSVIGFPDPVNEVAARLVAGGVVVLALATIGFDQPWLLVPLIYGFAARVLTGPTLSPLGQLVTRVVVPALSLPNRPYPGPPKRFAQGIGLAFSTTAGVLVLAGERPAAYIVLGALALAAALESLAGFCLGCRAFALLMKLGVIPEDVCVRCADIYANRGPDRQLSGSAS